MFQNARHNTQTPPKLTVHTLEAVERSYSPMSHQEATAKLQRQDATGTAEPPRQSADAHAALLAPALGAYTGGAHNAARSSLVLKRSTAKNIRRSAPTKKGESASLKPLQ